ncbi:pimeloyl-ACP methyl ester carboxylesterase [Thermocatellispora tengchongensis]|uniref:Pimeloyl-ACP methyl ester carboxylesterase n=1 Tax=Thermocatellispora tengchongensis TaxID=1073253 RepID=A0A840P4J9_9ACTN|nr:alpha/beta fold hydrolase [Thermocatellispora tengchongensis]MBB5132157.1 pimeloyl-ACP methyl ester carboxylesterase [Thermocatellispora tengchongensis]
MRYTDWGERSPRWAGIRSEITRVHGVRVGYLAAGAAPGAPPNAVPHLLVHPMAGSATIWLDVMRALSAYGPVFAPDMPGTMAGETIAPRPNAVRPETNARFLRAFAATLGLDRYVLHGWSMGGLVALMHADIAPRHVVRMVLTAPPLPGPLPPDEVVFWQTVGRAVLLAGPPLARVLLRVFGPFLYDAKIRRYSDPASLAAGGRLDVLGGDPSRIAPETVAVWAEELAEMRSRHANMGPALSAFAATLAAMFIRPARLREVIERVAAPVTLLYGDRDPLVQTAAIDDVTSRRPDWRVRVFPGAGHLLPLEVTAEYAAAAAQP